MFYQECINYSEVKRFFCHSQVHHECLSYKLSEAQPREKAYDLVRCLCVVHIRTQMYTCILMLVKRAKGDEEYIRLWLSASRSIGRYTLGRDGRGVLWRARDNRDEWAKGYESSWANIELGDTVSPHESYVPWAKRGTYLEVHLRDYNSRFSPILPSIPVLSFLCGGGTGERKCPSSTVTLRPRCRNMHIPNIDSTRDRVFARTSVVA